MPTAMISQAERANFLKQCWRTGHWKDGVGTLLLPMRLSLYRFRKELARSNGSKAAAQSAKSTPPATAPMFSDRITSIFAEPRKIDAVAVSHNELFAEVDAQLRGIFRLAGGRTRAVDAASIDRSEDAEDAHAYHRLYWILRYAQAAALGHEGAREALPRELHLWMDGKPENSAIAMWPYTLAERIGSLTSTLFWIQAAQHPELARLVLPIKHQTWKDAVRLSANVEYNLGVHNHLLNDARGLYLAGAALANECSESAPWSEQALSIWDEFFPKLVLEDGTFGEQSSHYHLLLCRTAFEYFLACRHADRALPENFACRLRKMFDLANELLRVDGSLPRFGHNSPDRTISDLRGLLLAAFHYGLLDRVPQDRAATPLSLFYCGAVPESPCAVAQQPNTNLFAAGGFAFLRSTALNATLVAHGDNRAGVGAHGDAGRGSYELSWNGDVLVREPGSFFSTSDPRADFFQSAAAQNVTTLDGLAPVVTKRDERFLASWYRPQGGAWRTLGNGAVEYRCDAFRRLHPDIVLTRTWKFERDDLLTFEERIEGTARVKFESHICFGDVYWHETPEADFNGRVTLRWQAPDGRSAEMTVQTPPSISVATQPCTWIPEYGVERPGRVLVLQGAQQLPFSWTVQWKLRKAA